MKDRILIVDDDPAFGKALSGLLRAKNYDVVSVESGIEGVLEFQRSGAQAVITDLMMPGTPGIAVIRQIREMSSEVVIIGISGGAGIGPSDGVRASALGGADIYLSKPFEGTELIDILENFLKPDVRTGVPGAFSRTGSL